MKGKGEVGASERRFAAGATEVREDESAAGRDAANRGGTPRAPGARLVSDSRRITRSSSYSPSRRLLGVADALADRPLNHG